VVSGQPAPTFPVQSTSGETCTQQIRIAFIFMYAYLLPVQGHVPRSREQPISCRIDQMSLPFVPGTRKYSGQPTCSTPDCSCAAHIAKNLSMFFFFLTTKNLSPCYGSVQWFLKAELGWNHHQLKTKKEASAKPTQPSSPRNAPVQNKSQ